MRVNLIWTMLLALLFVASTSSQIYAQKREKCPYYVWDITYLPISYLSFEHAPAKIIGTTSPSDETNGNVRLGIALRNSSSKSITAIKFQWYLFPNNIQLKKNISADQRAAFLEKILIEQDEVSVVDLIELQPDKDLEVQVTIPCEKVSNAVANVGRSERLATEFIVSPERLAIEFVVTEISFSDGSKWNRN